MRTGVARATERDEITHSVSDTPSPGFYRFRLRSDGVFVGIRIWYGPPHDPDTGEVMDRSLRWQAECNDRPIDIARVWPYCAGQPIDRAEYRKLAGLQSWATEHMPQSPLARPTLSADPLKMPLPF
jgi:hypothetical protein